jgi:hypothetical protein
MKNILLLVVIIIGLNSCSKIDELEEKSILSSKKITQVWHLQVLL